MAWYYKHCVLNSHSSYDTSVCACCQDTEVHQGDKRPGYFLASCTNTMVTAGHGRDCPLLDLTGQFLDTLLSLLSQVKPVRIPTL